MDEREIRMRCIEAAARFPAVHQSGPAAGVLETAQAWERWVRGGEADPRAAKSAPLGLPKK